MEKGIFVYLFVIYLIVLSEEANNQLLGQRTPHLLWLAVNVHKRILVLHTYVCFLWLVLYHTICCSPWPCVKFCKLCFTYTEARGPSSVICLQLILHIRNLRTQFVTPSVSEMHISL